MTDHVYEHNIRCIVTLIRCTRDIPLNNTMEYHKLFHGNGPIRFQYFYLYYIIVINKFTAGTYSYYHKSNIFLVTELIKYPVSDLISQVSG